MGRLFSGKEVEQFFEILHRPVCSQEEQAEAAGKAISCIAEELKIGRVTVNLTLPQSKLRAQVDNFTCVLYQAEAVTAEEEAVAMNFKTGDGGTVVFAFYAVRGHVWDEEELGEIRIVGRQIYTAFSQGIVQGLLKHAMLTDLVVGLPNVSGFMEITSGLFARGKLEKYQGIYMNIHNFKYVNKVLSHVQADEVMMIYARQLSTVLGKDEVVARLGGDNFVALVRIENAEKFIQFVCAMDVAYQYDGKEKHFHFGATIGVSQLKDLKDVGEVMTRISIAYQVARQQDGVGVVYYSDEIYREVMQQKEIIASFDHALEEQEFVVYYQPKVTTVDKKLCGAEALVRWKKKEQLLPPVQFVPILEKQGNICKLDFYVLDKVCAMLDKCGREGVPLTKVSVNFSRRHVDNPNLVNEIVAVIDRYHVPHEYLEIELTESEDFKDYIVLSKLITDLKAAGISTSIDDFGTGYSSLNMLKMTNVDILKIDKSFVPLEENAGSKNKDVIMFENIAHLAKELGIRIVVEGVETKQQYEYLAGAGCDMIQGFYFDKPLPEAVFWERMGVGHY